jgi:hypothetical protein
MQTPPNGRSLLVHRVLAAHISYSCLRHAPPGTARRDTVACRHHSSPCDSLPRIHAAPDGRALCWRQRPRVDAMSITTATNIPRYIGHFKFTVVRLVNVSGRPLWRHSGLAEGRRRGRSGRRTVVDFRGREGAAAALGGGRGRGRGRAGRGHTSAASGNMGTTTRTVSRAAGGANSHDWRARLVTTLGID